MIHEFKGFKLETSPVLTGWFSITNPINHDYCFLVKSGSDLFINITGTRVCPESSIQFLNEFTDCQQAFEHFSQILNKKHYAKIF